MMDTTVTMSLQRYKVLEAYETAFSLMDKKESFVIFGSSYENIYVFKGDDAISHFVDRYDRIEKRLDSVRSKIKEWSELKQKPDLYEYLSQTLYHPLP